MRTWYNRPLLLRFYRVFVQATLVIIELNGTLHDTELHSLALFQLILSVHSQTIHLRPHKLRHGFSGALVFHKTYNLLVNSRHDVRVGVGEIRRVEVLNVHLVASVMSFVSMLQMRLSVSVYKRKNLSHTGFGMTSWWKRYRHVLETSSTENPTYNGLLSTTPVLLSWIPTRFWAKIVLEWKFGLAK